jgi:hypothetical protein
MITIALLRAAGLTEAKVLRVAELEEAADRAANAARQARFRERKRNAKTVTSNASNVANVTSVTPQIIEQNQQPCNESNVTGVTHGRIGVLTSSSSTKESKKERRKKASTARKSALLAGWTLPEEGIAFARSKGWPEDRISTEALRFRDHAHANGRLQVDWAAAWRGWVTSPYRQSSNQNGGHVDGREQRLQDRNRRINEWESALADARAFAAGSGKGGGDGGTPAFTIFPPKRT